MPKIPLILAVVSLLFCVGSLQAQTDEPVSRDVPEAVELLLEIAVSASEPEQKQAAIARFLAALGDYYQSEFNLLYGAGNSSPFQVSFPGNSSPGTATIYSVALPKKLIHILQLANTVTLYEVDVAADRLASAIGYYVQELQISGSFGGTDRASAELYRWIMQPYAEDLRNAGIQKLLLINSKTLRSMPFATLFDGRRHVIDEFEFALSLGVEKPAVQSGTAGVISGDGGFELRPLPGEAVLAQSQRIVDSDFPILHLQSSYLLANAEAGLVSLWPGSAVASQQLVELFSAALLAEADYSEALQTAQRQMKSSGRFGHPFYWGAFMIVE